jgi:hypothetical protein
MKKIRLMICEGGGAMECGVNLDIGKLPNVNGNRWLEKSNNGQGGPCRLTAYYSQGEVWRQAKYYSLVAFPEKTGMVELKGTDGLK